MKIDIKKIKETNALSCLECGKCTGVCPVARYSESFSPRSILIQTLRNSNPSALDGTDLWSCLTCGQCDEICPWDIKYIDLIRLLRESSDPETNRGICSHGGIMQIISDIMINPNLKQQRLEWIDKKDKTSTSSEYLFFVGCLPYLDSLFADIGANPLKIARSTLQILNHFDIKPQILQDEKCCGHDFYWNGDRDNFQRLAEQNMEKIKKSGAKTVITSCPECHRTLKTDYSEIFGPLPFHVQHISEFIEEESRQQEIRLRTTKPQKITFQDPCRLGRHSGIYDAPRQALKTIEGLELQEMNHHHNRSVCCGVSGWMNCSQISKQIQIHRLQEAQATGAQTLVTACAKCQIHFQCALQDDELKKNVSFQIKDLTEIIAEHLQ